MYDLLVAVIMGIVEGLTEFLPVSSTGHLIFTGNILKFTGPKANAFEVIIQLGAILAVVLLYKEKFLFLIKDAIYLTRGTIVIVLKKIGLIKLVSEKTFKSINDEMRSYFSAKSANSRLTLIEIIAGMIPAVVLGFLLKDIIKGFGFNNNTSIAIALMAGGILLIIVEKVHIKTTVDNVDNVSIKQAFLIGLMQCLSLWPGFSRAGATISGGLFFGLNRKAAAEFSFILAVPIMFAASTLEFIDILGAKLAFTVNDFIQLGVGFLVSFIVAYFAIVYFIKLLSKVSFIPFAVYRLILGSVALIIIMQNI